jgi:hypothetical protein
VSVPPPLLPPLLLPMPMPLPLPLPLSGWVMLLVLGRVLAPLFRHCVGEMSQGLTSSLGAFAVASLRLILLSYAICSIVLLLPSCCDLVYLINKRK